LGGCGDDQNDGNAGATSSGGSSAVGGAGGSGGPGGAGGAGLAPGTSALVEVQSPRGVTLKTVVIAPSPVATMAVILLEGGDGKVNFTGTADQPVIDSSGFLARNATAFSTQGLLVAIVDVPSDYATSGIDVAYRTSAEQAQDVGAVIDWLDSQIDVPIWVLGMSAASYSATNSAIRLGSELDGYGVCSGSTQPGGSGPYPNGILDLQMDQIAVPSIVIGHQDDACPGTPATGVPLIVAALTGAPKVSHKIFTGGDPPVSSPCGPLAPHGYYGIDSEVVTYLANTMKTP